MIKKVIMGIIFLIFTSFFIYFAYFVVKDIPNNTATINLKVGEKNYLVEVAKTSQEREKGLAKFDSIENNQGMLFIFDTPGTYSIWMKDMKFNIDIIFLDENKKVINIFPNVKFESYKSPFDYEEFKPDFPAKYVIELKEGEVKENGVKVGDRLNF